MHFHANYVSTSIFGDGDYYQATFQAEQDTDDPDSPYLLIQRQFEDPGDSWFYIETHDEKYRGHFLLRRVDFTAAEVVNRARSSEGQSCQRHLCDAGHGVRGSITGGKDH
jgi:hypothetical protein